MSHCKTVVLVTSLVNRFKLVKCMFLVVKVQAPKGGELGMGPEYSVE